MDSVQTWMKNHDEILEKTTTKMNETSSRLEKLEERVSGGFDRCDRRATNQERAQRKASLVERRLQDNIIKLEAMEREVEENHDWTKDSISELQEHYHASAAANNGNDY